MDYPIQPVFHISYLKQKLGDQIVPFPTLPSLDFDGFLSIEPIAILQQRSKQLLNHTIIEVLVQWRGQFVENATW